MANKYWVGNSTAGNTTPASANWNGTNAWRTTSGGTVTATTPGTGDVAIFDNNSFLGAAITVTISAATTVGSIDASGITSGANGITLAGLSNSLALSGGSATGSLLKLPSSRFTWSHSSTLTISGSGTVTTNGVLIYSNVSMTSTAAQPTLAGDFNGRGTYTCNGGTVTLGTYQWVCTTFTSTGSTATAISASTGGGITVTGTSSTVINVTKTAAQLTFPSAKPIFTLTGSPTTGTRGITWSGATWATSTSTMPGLIITGGSDTVAITQTVSSNYANLASLNTTGFSGTLQYTTAPISLFVFGDFLVNSGPLTFTGYATNIVLCGTSNSFSANLPSISFRLLNTAVYTQSGVMNCFDFTEYSSITTGSMTLNSTGTISGGFTLGAGIYSPASPFLFLSGNISVGTIPITSSQSIGFYSADTTALTSITKTGSSDSGTFSIGGGTYGSTIPFVFNGTNASVTFYLTTINGTITFNNALSNTLTITQSNIANTLTVTARQLYLNGLVNIPSTSAITLSGGTNISYTATGVTFTNKFRVNLIPVYGSGYQNVIVADQSGGNDPDFYASGNGTLLFYDGGTYSVYASTFDANSFTGSFDGGGSGTIYVKVAFIQTSFNGYATVTPFGGGTVSINASSLYQLSCSDSTTTNIISSAISISNSIGFTAGTLNLNSCTATFTAGSSLNLSGSTVLNAGTSTVILNYGTINVVSGNRLYNVVIANGSSPNTIYADYIANLTNSTQPVTVNFGRNISFGTFGLNGTAGNLVTITSNLSTQRTLTKSTPWNLGNSTDGGNNAGLNFLGSGSGNNNYLSVSYINGVFALPITGDTASGFAGTTTYLKDVTVGATSVSASGFAATPIYALTSAVTNASASGVAATPTYAYSTLLGNNTANGFVGTETYSNVVLVNATGVAASGFASTPAYALTTTLANTSASGFAATPAYALTAPLTNVSASGFASTPAYSYLTLLSGNAASGLLGTVIYLKDVNVGATSVTASGFASSPTYAIDTTVTSTTGSGVVATPTYEVAPSLASVVGSGVASGIGSYTAQYRATGTYANGLLGTVISIYWKQVDTVQNANWALISDAQAPTWTVVDNSQGGGWTPVNT